MIEESGTSPLMIELSQKFRDGLGNPQNRRTGNVFSINKVTVDTESESGPGTPEVRCHGKAFSGRHNRGPVYSEQLKSLCSR